MQQSLRHGRKHSKSNYGSERERKIRSVRGDIGGSVFSHDMQAATRTTSTDHNRCGRQHAYTEMYVCMCQRHAPSWGTYFEVSVRVD